MSETRPDRPQASLIERAAERYDFMKAITSCATAEPEAAPEKENIVATQIPISAPSFAPLRMESVMPSWVSPSPAPFALGKPAANDPARPATRTGLRHDA